MKFVASMTVYAGAATALILAAAPDARADAELPGPVAPVVPGSAGKLYGPTENGMPLAALDANGELPALPDRNPPPTTPDAAADDGPEVAVNDTLTIAATAYTTHSGADYTFYSDASMTTVVSTLTVS